MCRRINDFRTANHLRWPVFNFLCTVFAPLIAHVQEHAHTTERIPLNAYHDHGLHMQTRAHIPPVYCLMSTLYRLLSTALVHGC